MLHSKIFLLVEKKRFSAFEFWLHQTSEPIRKEHVCYVLQTLPIQFQEPFDRKKFRFDQYFLPNIEASSETYVRVKVILSFDQSTDKSACLRKQEIFFKRHSGWLQARIRDWLHSQDSTNILKQINDNFLNFLSKPQFDHIEALRRLERLASVNKKVLLLKQCIEHVINTGDADNGFCLSFNGGKDCTVLLHTLASLYLNNVKSTDCKHHLNLLLIKCGELFIEQELFIKRALSYYGRCRLLTYQGTSLKSTLETIRGEQPFRTILMGVRRTDFLSPYRENLQVEQKTDAGWPEFTRISPLLDWSYSDVWTFLISLDVPYCSLYDYGYTSLDYITNTVKNDTLKVEAVDNHQPIYLAACLLEQENMERMCRS